MLNGFFSLFSHDMGIDLGTANTLVYVKGKGILINEPSVVALNLKTKQILAIGEEARKMVGKTPAHIVAIRPLVDGVISDFEVTEQMLKYFIDRVHQERFVLFPRPRVVIGIPYGVTEVERRAVEEAAINSGASGVYLIEEPLAAAIGARLPVQEPAGNMVVDIGGGTTEVAVISMGGVVASRSIRVAGDEMNEDIINFTRDHFNLLIGPRAAEEIKIAAGSALPLVSRIAVILRGRDLVTGLPREITISDEHVREALKKSVNLIVDAVKSTIEETPPELLGEIMQKGIVLTGGGALLRGLDQLVSQSAEIAVVVAEDPLTCVVRGCGIVLEDIDSLKEVLLPTEFTR